MIIQIFWEDKSKEYFFKNIMDERYELNFYSNETGLSFDIKLFIDINNGIKKISGRNIKVYYEDKSENVTGIIENDVKYLVRIKNSVVALLMYESRADIIDFKKYIVNSSILTVGKNGTIDYTAGGRIRELFELNYEENKAYVIPAINRIYHNGKRIDHSEKTRVRFGDIISYNKFKLIYLGNIVAVNNPDYEVQSLLEEFVYSESPRNISAEKEDYKFFTRSPRIVHRLISERVDIDAPPTKRENRDKPLLLTIGPSMTMSLAMMVSVFFMIRYGSSGRSIVPSAAMACSMFAGAVIWPIALRKYTRKQIANDEATRNSKYFDYINSIDKKLAEMTEYNKQVYTEMYPAIDELYGRAKNTETTLWNQSPYDDGFLDVRIGTGNRKFTVDINIPKDKFSVEDDPLKKYAQEVKDKYSYVPDVPVSVDLRNMNILGILGEKDKRENLVKLIIAELLITHCYTEVKIGAIFNAQDINFSSFVKKTPHIWESGRRGRFAASDKEGAYTVIKRIKDIYNERLEIKDTERVDAFLPHYVIFVTDDSLLENNSGIKEFVHNAEGCGITFVFACDVMGQLPLKCRNIIQLSSESCTFYSKDDDSGKMSEFIPDSCGSINLEKLAEFLAPVKVNEALEEASIPEKFSFFDLYKAKNIDALNIAERWKAADVSKSLAAPIGAVSGGIFSLDIHEKAHGSHGLIAGTTGSGKSEFIMSYILSMAVNYHPHDVAFVLIDYKGGGMANAFVDLPHVVGTITNINGNQIKRSMISLKSEVVRRQVIFDKVGVKHIDEYQKLYKKALVSEPMPHLVIISDEFAELKLQEPEFMSEIIRISRIGRSLGVHLILATQKPSGVVNDQIWSNTNFRVCLKVQDRADSKEMLKRDEAASITLPGRAYVQVGNDEIFVLVQSGYSGSKYLRNESNISDNSALVVSYIDLLGRELCRFDGSKGRAVDTEETQLMAVVKYIKEYTESLGIKINKIWKPALPQIISLDTLDKRKGGFNGSVWEECSDVIKPVVGLYDDPANQDLGPVYMDFVKNGHAILYGAPGTGKTTFIQTLIYSIVKRNSPDIVNLYILDFESRSLSYCKELPHVGDVLFSNDEDKIKKLFPMLDAEIESRKIAFGEYSVGNMSAYIQAGGKRLPYIIIIIDNYASFYELYGMDYSYKIEKLARDGANYGIFLVLTAAALNTVKQKVKDNIGASFVLQMNDVFDYQSILGRKESGKIEPENVKGRGLVKLHDILEFQTALSVNEVNEAERAAKVIKEFKLMAKAWKGNVPMAIPVIPSDMCLSTLSAGSDFVNARAKGLIPIGYNTETIDLVTLDLYKKPIFMVNGENDRANTLACIIKECGNREIWLCDDVQGSVKELCTEIDIKEYVKGGSELSVFINKLVTEAVSRHNAFREYDGNISKKEFMKQYPEIILVIDDFDLFFDTISNEDLAKFGQTVNVAGEMGIYMIISINSGSSSKYKGTKELKSIFNVRSGIVLGISGLSDYNINLSYDYKKSINIDSAFLINKNKYSTIRLPFITREE